MKRRAISDTDKQVRREQILTTALALYAEHGYAGISMNQVAEAAGLAKGTLYLYFKTKEELFLALLDQALTDWFTAVEPALRASREPLAPDDFVAMLAHSLAGRAQLLRLVAILHTVLEQNIDYDAALAFKRNLAIHSARVAELLEARLEFLAPGEGLRLLQRIHALIIGLQHQAEPSAVVREVLALPELSAFRVDFQQEFLITVRALVHGLAQLRSMNHG